MTLKKTVGLCAGAIALASIAAPAIAAPKTISLTAVDGYPPRALQVKTFIEHFIPEVDKRLAAKGNYKINWNQAWSGQIVKVRHVLPGMQKGLGDIGVVTSVFHQDKVPMQAVAYVTPFVSDDPVLVSQTMDELAEKFPAMKEAWGKYNQVLLTSYAVIDSYQMFFKDDVQKIADFQGKKVAGAGINMRYLTGTGATPVIGSFVNYYNQFKTGVIDGSMLWVDAWVDFKLVEVAPYMFKADIGTANSKALTMNENAYKKLPEEVRQAIHAVSATYRDYTAKAAIKDGEQAMEQFKKGGGKVAQITDEERVKWAKTMPNMAKEWAADLDKQNLPGTKMLNAYMDKMRATNQKIVRQWDKE